MEMDKKCRLCLSKEKLIWIFDKRIINTNKLSDIIYNATGVHISETDAVTQMVCHECCLYTVDIYKFRVKCLINNNLLHSFVNACDAKVKLELPPAKDEPPESPKSPRKRSRAEVRMFDRPSEFAKKLEDAMNVNSDKFNNDRGRDRGEDKSDDENNQNCENVSTLPEVKLELENKGTSQGTHRLMLTRAKRKLKTDIERRKLDKQKIIESLYAENIDKIMFTSYLKLAPKYDISMLDNSTYKEGRINCKLCKSFVESGNSLREHLERECEVFKMVDHLPTVNLVRLESSKTMKDKYPGVLRNLRANKKPSKFKCSCCQDCGD